MANCLVVGGNGFLGSHLVDELAAAGHTVTAFDRFSHDRPTFGSSAVRSVTGDFFASDQLRAALEGQELLFHFLSTTTPATASADPTLDVRTNVMQSIELFDMAADAGVRRVYFASTGGAMYGNSGAYRVAETVLPAPVSPYAIGKQAIESYLRFFQRTRGLESTSFRISNPYGPRQHVEKKQGVIPIFLHRIAQGLPVEVYGDGSMVRDFIFAEDAARMIVSTVGSEPAHPVYNVGSGVGTTVNEVLDLARAVTGRDVAVEHKPKPATFVDRVVLDTGLFTAEFGEPALRSLSEGMEQTWSRTLLELE